MKKKNNSEYCYWCGAPSTTREHVPPKCLFPEGKDINGILSGSYRNNLITVPSCDKHNLSKSNDDEYLMACLASRVGNNAEAYLHTCTKVRRAFERSPSLIEILGDDVITINSKEYPVQWARMDMRRLFYSFEAIARALFYHEFGARFEGDCRIVTRLCNNPTDNRSTAFNIRACEIIEHEISNWNTEVKGDNPTIFTYQFSPEDGFKCRTLCLTFYKNTKVYAALSRLSSSEQEALRRRTRQIMPLVFGDVFEEQIVSED